MMKSVCSLRKALLSTVVLAAVAAPIYAQGTASAVNIDDIVVTASKTEETIKAAPQAVQVITAQDMRDLGADSLISGLALANNVDINSQGMTGNEIRIRGMETRHTLVLVDGRRVSGEDAANTANVYTLTRIPLSQVERVEIVRGSGSALYGSEAMGGVINIITKSPKKAEVVVGASTGTRLQNNWYRYASGDQGRWNVTVGADFSKVRPINIAADGGGYNRNQYGPKQNFDVSAIYNFKNANNNKLRFDATWHKEHLRSDEADSQTTMFTNTRPMPVFAATSELRYKSKDKYETYNIDMKNYSLEYSGKTKKNAYTLRSYYSVLDRNYSMYNHSDAPNYKVTVFTPKTGGGMSTQVFDYPTTYPKFDHDTAKYSTWVTEFHDSMFIGDKHTLTFGAENRRVSYEGTRVGTSEKIDGGWKKTAKSHSVNSYAGFVEDTWQVTDKLILQPAIRYEHNDQFGSNTSPRIGATYNINDTTRFKANYGKSYKAPSISELYINFFHSAGPTMVHVEGNPNLKPEKSTSYDFSLEAERGKTSLKASYFNNKVTNLIDSSVTITPTEMHSVYHNVSKARLAGTEFSIEHKLSDRWSTAFWWNHLRATDEDNAALPRLTGRPEDTFTVQLNYNDHKAYGYSATLYNSYYSNLVYNKTVGSRGNSITYQQAYSYNSWNLAVTKRYGESLSIFAAVDNIFDKQIEDIDILGRAYRVGAEFKF